MQKGSPNSLTPMQKQQEYLSIASAFLAQGLTHDEQQDYSKALECYNQGIEVLQEALEQQYPPADQSKVAPINEKMRRHLANFADRVGTLQVIVRQPPKPKPKAANGGMLSKLFWGKAPAKNDEEEPKPEPMSDEQLARLRVHFQETQRRPSPKPSTKPTKRSHSASGASRVQTPSGGRTAATVSKPPAKKTALGNRPAPGLSRNVPSGGGEEGPPLVKRLEKAGIDPKLLDQVLSSIISKDQVNVSWDDVMGLADAKQALYEAAILPLQRPDLFTGLRAPARGILLFGPPGTGKTFIAKACAYTVQATFFSLSASTLTSKYVGEGEKLVKAVFMAAQELQPAIIFIDEIDSLLTSRSDHENEASRRLKTEFMVQMEGLSSAGESSNVLVLGATNRPYELDDAILRRFPRRLYIPLPDASAREMLFANLVGKECQLSQADLKALAKATEGYSNSDITNVCREAVMVPIRELGPAAASVPLDQVRTTNKNDFVTALRIVRPSCSEIQLKTLQKWHAKYGSA